MYHIPHPLSAYDSIYDTPIVPFYGYATLNQSDAHKHSALDPFPRLCRISYNDVS